MENDWNRAWTPEEIARHADNWSLAGDAALLNTLQEFSENMQKNIERVSKRLDDLVNRVDEVGLQFELARNKFHSLRNVQFMESRVYEDDETLDSKTEEKNVEKTVPEDEENQQILEAIKTGMKILDEYYEKVEVSVSDSEDESERSFVLQPKDRYSHRPLPPIIGTEEWYKDELDEDSSDSGSGQISKVQSESESEEDSPKKLIKGSETSSELGFSSQVNVTGASQKDDKHSDEESVSEGPPLSFAEQLAAKLGDVISQQEEVPSPEVNTKPIQPKKSSAFTDIFSDEPPPLDDLDDLQKDVKTSLFSGGTGLFDDNEDEELWREDKKSADLEKKEEVAPKSVKVSKGLFDHDQSSDEDIFSPPKLPKQTFLKSEKPNIPLFAEEPPALEKKTGEPPKKKPVGAVSLFGSHDLFDDLMKQTQKRDDLNRNILAGRKQRRNLFDDDTDDLVLPKAIGTKKSNALDESNNNFKFGNEESTEQPVGNMSKEKPKRISLFDDDDIPEIKDTKNTNLFNEKESPEQSIFDDREPLSSIFENKTPNKPKVSNLFDDDEEWTSERRIPDIASNKVPERRKNISLFDDDEEIESKGTESDIHNPEQLVETTKQEKSKKISLFDDEDDIGSGEIFNSVKFNINSTEEQMEQKSNNLFDEDEIESKIVESPVVHKTVTDTEEKIVETSQEISKKVSLFDEDEEMKSKETDFDTTSTINDEQSIKYPSQQEKPKTITLFDDEDEDFSNNDVFADLETSLSNNLASLRIRGNETEESTERSRQSPVLFNMSPPPDDEGESDTGSERTPSEQDDVALVRGNRGFDNVFFDEPPLLDSGIPVVSERLYSSDSDFNPICSSTRRRSSSIFHDEEFIDEFFLTKNEPEQSSPYLNAIPEHDNKTSFLDITPSGLLEDLDTTEHESMQPPKEPDPTEELPKDKITSMSKLPKNESGKKIESKESTAPPGKLKHNLNINVSALIPGSAPPQKLKKSQSLETDAVDNSSNKRSSSFDEAIENVQVLQSITKDRVKIPIKRKPSTRRGRQARMYQQDEGKSDASGNAKNDPKVEPQSGIEKTSHDPSPLIKEGTACIDRPSNISPKEIPSESSKRPLFDDEDSDHDLFSPKQASKASRKSLFNDSTSSSEDDDLFKPAKSQKNVPKSVLNKGAHKGSVLKKLENVETSEDPLSNLLS